MSEDTSNSQAIITGHEASSTQHGNERSRIMVADSGSSQGADYWPPKRTRSWRPEPPSRLAKFSKPPANASAVNDSELQVENEGIPTAGHSTNSVADCRVKPKNFSRPVTCYYWAANGTCTKTDNECSYAHYWTDIVATAPIKLSADGGPVAGREAERLVSQIPNRGELVKARESRLALREEILASETIRLNDIAQNLTKLTGKLNNELGRVDEDTDSSMGALKRRHSELKLITRHADRRWDWTRQVERAVYSLEQVTEVLTRQRQHSNETGHHLKILQAQLEEIQERTSSCVPEAGPEGASGSGYQK